MLEGFHLYVRVLLRVLIILLPIVLICHYQFQRDVGEREEHAGLWIGYCAFHLGDYRKAMEVVIIILCVFVSIWVYNREMIGNQHSSAHSSVCSI